MTRSGFLKAWTLDPFLNGAQGMEAVPQVSLHRHLKTSPSVQRAPDSEPCLLTDDKGFSKNSLYVNSQCSSDCR